MLRAQAALAAQRREITAQRDERKERENLPMPVLGDNVGDAFEVRLDCVAKVVGVVVAGRRAHGVEVDFQRDGLGADRDEPVLPDEIEQRHLVGDVLVVAPEVLFVAAIGRGGDAEHEGVLIEMA